MKVFEKFFSIDKIIIYMVIIFFIAVSFYIANFEVSEGFSLSPDDWASFGSYISPFTNILMIAVLLYTLQQQKKQTDNESKLANYEKLFTVLNSIMKYQTKLFKIHNNNYKKEDNDIDCLNDIENNDLSNKISTFKFLSTLYIRDMEYYEYFHLFINSFSMYKFTFDFTNLQAMENCQLLFNSTTTLHTDCFNILQYLSAQLVGNKYGITSDNFKPIKEYDKLKELLNT